ncbi:hypothetical protein EBN03_33395 [Nocardia stercoris]|uniref:Transposase n=1 Tax=Nocardia stercoris TaxID=2483361 RepID=A0A3M2KZ93_9NOCA|nr:hypothetical protein EBN03_33395 [Nocardia stercoris]
MPPEFTSRANRGSAGGRPPVLDPVVYRDSSTVEHRIDQLEQHRGVATRYGKLAVRKLVAVHVAVINQWL